MKCKPDAWASRTNLLVYYKEMKSKLSGRERVALDAALFLQNVQGRVLCKEWEECTLPVVVKSVGTERICQL